MGETRERLHTAVLNCNSQCSVWSLPRHTPAIEMWSVSGSEAIRIRQNVHVNERCKYVTNVFRSERYRIWPTAFGGSRARVTFGSEEGVKKSVQHADICTWHIAHHAPWILVRSPPLNLEEEDGKSSSHCNCCATRQYFTLQWMLHVNIPFIFVSPDNTKWPFPWRKRLCTLHLPCKRHNSSKLQIYLGLVI